MKSPLGEHGRRLPRFRSQDTPEPEPELEQPTETHATAPGDTRKLRGIPAIARGVAGAITHTIPHLFDKTPGKPHNRE